MAEIKTSISELPESRVRLDVEIPASEVQSQIERTAKIMGRELRLPGFREGKAPTDLVIKRIGREGIFQQMLRDSLDSWCRSALLASPISSVGEPKLEFGEMPEEGDALDFKIEIGTMPKTKLGKYKGLEAGKREANVPDDAIDEEIERLRQSVARLEQVDRALKKGDFAVLDFDGKVDGEPFEGGEARDYSLEIGSNRLIEGFEEQLEGASAGERRQVEITFPDEYGQSSLAGKEAVFDVEIKAVQEASVPDIDDELARQVSEFDTIEELKTDVEKKLILDQERSIEGEYREAVIDSAVKESEIDLPEKLVFERAHEMWHQMEHKLQQQGVSADQYSQITGKSREQILEDLNGQAETGLKRESLLAAVVEEEGFEVSDDELLVALEAAVQGDGKAPADLLAQLKSTGQDRAIREDLLARKAIELMEKESKPLSVEQAQAKEKLWTPDEERPDEATEIWTPGKK